MKPKFRELDKDSDCPDVHMPLEAFLNDVRLGCFTEDDGEGEYATATQVSNIRIPVANILNLSFQPPDWATHVVWYGK